MDKLLHIYPQDFWHTPALIIGQKDALEGLVNAIQQAIKTGQGKVDVFTSDGEGYETYVVLENSGWNQDIWHNSMLPYTDEIAKGGNKEPWELIRK